MLWSLFNLSVYTYAYAAIFSSSFFFRFFFSCILCLGFIFSECEMFVSQKHTLMICATTVHHHFFLMIIYLFFYLILFYFFCSCCCCRSFRQILFQKEKKKDLFMLFLIPVTVDRLKVTRLSVTVIIWNLYSEYFAHSSMCDNKRNCLFVWFLFSSFQILGKQRNVVTSLQVDRDCCSSFHWEPNIQAVV